MAKKKPRGNKRPRQRKSVAIAMWHVYHGRCAYEERELELEDVVVDHVVPLDQLGDPDTLRALLLENGVEAAAAPARSVPEMRPAAELGWAACDPTGATEPLATPETLFRAIGGLQRHFGAHKELGVSSRAAAGLYRFLIWCLRNLDLPEHSRGFVRSSLWEHVQASLGNLEADPADHPESRSPSDSFAMDFALRAAVEILKEGELRTSWNDVRTEARTQILPLIEEVETITYLRRLETKPW
jgi:hypothetical protein